MAASLSDDLVSAWPLGISESLWKRLANRDKCSLKNAALDGTGTSQDVQLFEGLCNTELIDGALPNEELNGSMPTFSIRLLIHSLSGNDSDVAKVVQLCNEQGWLLIAGKHINALIPLSAEAASQCVDALRSYAERVVKAAAVRAGTGNGCKPAKAIISSAVLPERTLRSSSSSGGGGSSSSDGGGGSSSSALKRRAQEGNGSSDTDGVGAGSVLDAAHRTKKQHTAAANGVEQEGTGGGMETEAVEAAAGGDALLDNGHAQTGVNIVPVDQPIAADGNDLDALDAASANVNDDIKAEEGASANATTLTGPPRKVTLHTTPTRAVAPVRILPPVLRRNNDSATQLVPAAAAAAATAVAAADVIVTRTLIFGAMQPHQAVIAASSDPRMTPVVASFQAGGLVVTEVDVPCLHQWLAITDALMSPPQPDNSGDAYAAVFKVANAEIRIATPFGRLQQEPEFTPVDRVITMKQLQQVSIDLRRQLIFGSKGPAPAFGPVQYAVCMALEPLTYSRSSYMAMDFSHLLGGCYWGLALCGDSIVRLRVIMFADCAQRVTCTPVCGGRSRRQEVMLLQSE